MSLPHAQPLTKLLPAGAAGGLEFARIMDLLLFHDARQKGWRTTLFDDRAGDYHGLDCIVHTPDGDVGYQHKFYPEPLSTDHRSTIKKALQQAIDAHTGEKIQLKRWVIVTPEDWTNAKSGREKNDLDWFADLEKELKPPFELEHYGQKEIDSLFLDNPSLCYFYYRERAITKKPILSDYPTVLADYKTTLEVHHGKIIFVGLGVYKEQASEGVDMARIYIPLTLQDPGSKDDHAKRYQPAEVLQGPGISVILGDPGCGKSTLMKFLALAGHHQPLQKKYELASDERLPVLVVLRKYAEKLAKDENTDLTTFIADTMRADHENKELDPHFLESHLMAGRCLLLFDGMDEVASQALMIKVRDRIRAIAKRYPLNRIVITSRIIGYDQRFDDNEAKHFHVAPLDKGQIEQFIRDWYGQRIRAKKLREDNIQDMVKILEDPNSDAIRELAKNPLLLTIMILVHRIDAVLPDQRVVLYQKCTEALLNTWVNWREKGGQRDAQIRTEERLNQQRIEAIAYWMHHHRQEDQAGATVPYKDLCRALTKHIKEKEAKFIPNQCDALSVAEDFLEFIKKRAGLMIEIGQGYYSFVHLTFQEYLAGKYVHHQIIEEQGILGGWNEIELVCRKVFWVETLRLLIAGLKSNQSQAFLIENMIKVYKNDPEITLSRLLGGLLLDRIDVVHGFTQEVLEVVYHSCLLVDDRETLLELISIVAKWRASYPACNNQERNAVAKLWKDHPQMREPLWLIASCAGWELGQLEEINNSPFIIDSRGWFAFLVFKNNEVFTSKMEMQLGRFVQKLISAGVSSSSAMICVALFMNWLGSKTSHRLLSQYFFNCQMASAFFIGHCGPDFYQMAVHNLQNIGSVSAFKYVKDLAVKRNGLSFSRSFSLSFDRALDRASAFDKFRALSNRFQLSSEKTSNPADKDQSNILKNASSFNWARDYILLRNFNFSRNVDAQLSQVYLNIKDVDISVARNYVEALDRLADLSFALMSPSESKLLQEIKNSHSIYDISSILVDFLQLEHRPAWKQYISNTMTTDWFATKSFLQPSLVSAAKTNYLDNKDEKSSFYLAAVLLHDAMCYVYYNYLKPEESPFQYIAEITRNSNNASLVVAHCIRDFAHGDDSKLKLLKDLVDSEDPDYKKVFVHSFWRDP